MAAIQGWPQLVELIAGTLWLLAPAYLANSTPVVFSGSKPLDFNHTFRGQPLLGPGKTIGGTFFGFVAGLLTTLALLLLQSLLSLSGLPQMSLELGSLLTIGALFGDISASFIKRRLSWSQGEPVLLLDQLDFYLGAVLLSSLLFFDYRIFLVGLLITPPIHKLFNLLAFKLALKDVSW